nr:MAG TPA: hypothetical protein [Caudoviricetes sp.]
MTQATTRDYWISPSALHIELNALGNTDYIQASCMSGAQILVYVKDIIDFDAGHNYRRWPLQAAPTVFNTHTEKYVYAAIPRDMTFTASAWIVFPSEQIDIYGKNEKEEQIGNEKYYYIFLQGIITSSGDNGTVQRDWKKGGRIVFGYLSSDEAISAIPYESEWYNYSSVDGIVTFLKDITMKAGTKFRQLFAKTLTIMSGGKIAFEGQGEVNGVAIDSTSFDSVDKIVTPNYLDNKALSKVHEDVAKKVITFMEGLTVGLDGKKGIDAKGNAVLGDVIVDRVHDPHSTESDRTIIGAQGFDLYMGDDGKSHLFVDYLTARTRMFASSVEIRKVSYSGGTTIFSNAGSQIAKVSYIYDEAKQKVIAYKCYAVADDRTTKTMNWWHVGMMALCQTFNVKDGENEKLANRYYWRMVVGVGQEKLDGKLYDYVILSNIKEFQGNLLTIPTYSDKTLANEQQKKLVWGNVMVEVTMEDGMQTLASLFAEQENGRDDDDGGNKIADRMFYGYDGDKEPDAPAPYDVIVQVGDQIQWKKYGNVIKLSTSTEDSAKDNDNAPAITMYHKLGAPHYTGSLDANGNKIINPYQWKIITTIISPEKVMHNTDNFQLFQGTPDNIVDPITIMHDIVPSVAYYTRHPSTQTTTPTDITFSLRKRTGNKIETLDDAQIYAEYTLLDGSSNTKLLANKALSDIGNLYQITSVKLKSTIKEADHEDIVVTLDLPVLTDGVKGDQGVAYQVMITSDTGTVLINGSGEMTLKATLLCNGEDISDTIGNSAWSWWRQSADAEDDAVWNRLHEGVGRSCLITRDDVDRQAQFGCRVYISDTKTINSKQ